MYILQRLSCSRAGYIVDIYSLFISFIALGQNMFGQVKKIRALVTVFLLLLTLGRLGLLLVRGLLHLPLLLGRGGVLVELCLLVRVDLAPHLAHDLGDLADGRLGVLLPHLRPHRVHEEEVGRHRPLRRVGVLHLLLLLLGLGLPLGLLGRHAGGWRLDGWWLCGGWGLGCYPKGGCGWTGWWLCGGWG